MNFIVILLELACLFFLCVALGRRVVDLLPPIMHRTMGFYVAPILGLAFLVLFATLYGWLSPFKPMYSIPAACGLAAVAVAFERKKRQMFREYVHVVLFGVICSLPILASVLLYDGYNPLTDIFTYLVQSQWLQSHSFAEKAVASGYYPALSQVVNYQTSGSRMGGSFLLGYVQSLFALRWSYDAYLATVSLSFVAGCLSMGGIIRQVVPVRKSVVLALAIIPAFSMNGFVYGAEWGFFPQTLGLAFALGLTALYPYLTKLLVSRDCSWVRIARYVLPASLCTAGLLFAYNEPFPIFAAAMGLFIIITVLTHLNAMKAIGVCFAFYALEVLVLIHYEAIRIAKNLYQTLSISHGLATIGWPVLWSPLQFLAHSFGLKTPFENGIHGLDYAISTWGFAVFFTVLCVILFRFMRVHLKRRVTLSFLFCVELVLVLFFLKFRYLSPSMSAIEVGHTFLQFKISKYTAPFSLALGGIGWAIVWYYGKTYRLFLAYFFAAVMVLGLILQCFGISKNLNQHFLTEMQRPRSPFEALLQLREAVSSIAPDEVIHIDLGESHSKLRQMVAYVLYDRKIASDYRDDGYIVGQLPLGERVMSPQNANWLITTNANSDLCPHNGQSVGPFLLLKEPFHYTTLDTHAGAYNTESDAKGNTLSWVANAANFSFTTTGVSHEVRYRFSLKNHADPRKFSLQLKTDSGEVLAQDFRVLPVGATAIESPWLKTEARHFILHVEADGKPERLSKRDGREAKFVIMNLKLCAR